VYFLVIYSLLRAPLLRAALLRAAETSKKVIMGNKTFSSSSHISNMFFTSLAKKLYSFLKSIIKSFISYYNFLYPWDSFTCSFSLLLRPNPYLLWTLLNQVSHLHRGGNMPIAVDFLQIFVQILGL